MRLIQVKDIFIIQIFLDGLKVPSESIIRTIEFLEKNNLGKKKLIID